MKPEQISACFFLQMLVIIAVSRVVGWVGKRFLGQPQVVGEMIAGVLLGPSLFGAVAPGFQDALFPKASRDILYVGAQFGVGLYMFLVGLGLRRDGFRGHGRSAVVTSLSGMAAPFAAALLVGPWLLGHGLFGKGVGPLQAVLFTGAAISITAFPMLARIIHERGLSETPIGTLCLTAGAVDDAGAWIVFAIVLASFGGGPWVAVKAIVGAAVFATFMILLAPRLLAPLGRMAERAGKVGPTILAVVLGAFFLCASAMDSIGLHAVFGGFLLGTAMPRGLLSKELRRQLEPFTVVILLPMFFTFSGLNTRLGMVGSVEMLLIAGAVLAVSVIAKGGACWAAARLSGQDNPTALAIGALMNSRGLMELILINLGLQRGIIGPPLFSVLVLMAIMTTLMASPLFELAYGRRARAEGTLGALREEEGDDLPAMMTGGREAPVT
ncbi:cation:proton antiporter [Caulobacter sp. S45]|uniref:cation:proton antiporter n=1 Tax=Caulobacter sp. S45 TaxID=1641861 RepID=UPI00131C9DF9|nr:cation:proton antiporter [Caulobacter sp. S45]